MKKFLAIFLTVAMLASFMVVPAFAAADDVLITTPAGTTSNGRQDVYTGTPYTIQGTLEKDQAATLSVTSTNGATVGAVVISETPTEVGGNLYDFSVPVTATATGDIDVTIQAKDSGNVSVGAAAVVYLDAQAPSSAVVGKIRNATTRASVTNTYVPANLGTEASFELVNNTNNAYLSGYTFDWKVFNPAGVEMGTTATNPVYIKDGHDAQKATLKVNAGAAKGIVYTVEVTATKAGVDPTVARFFFGVAGESSTVKYDSISIKQPSSTLLVENDQIKLEVNGAPSSANEDLFFYSNVPSVISVVDVNKGEIRALRAGSARITVITASGKTSFIDLTVMRGTLATDVRIVGDLALNNSAVGVDDAKQLELSMSPYNGSKTGINWSFVAASGVNTGTVTIGGTSYDTSVLTTQGGTITLVKDLGKIYISSPLTGALPAAIVVKVEVPGTGGRTLSHVAIVTVGATSSVTEVSITTRPSFDRLVTGQSFPLKATLKDATGKTPTNNKVYWFSTDTNVATVDVETGVITAKNEGVARIYAESAETLNGVAVASGHFDLTVVEKVEGGYKTVKAYTVKVRALPSSNSTELAVYKKGTLVNAVEELGAWTKISYSGSYAYVATSALTDVLEGSVISTSLTVRNAPNSDGAKIATISFGTRVRIIGVHADNPAWMQIMYKDTTAFVAAKYIVDGELTGIVTSSSLTLRAGASTTAPQYAERLYKGQTVEIIGKSGSFFQVKLADGSTGFAAANYIGIL